MYIIKIYSLEEIFFIILLLCARSEVELVSHNVYNRYILIMHALYTHSMVIL
jgi:hypothetical protein